MPDDSGGYKTVREQIRERRERQAQEAKPLLLEEARKELSKVRGKVPGQVPSWEPVPLMDWIPEVSPEFDSPTHLRPLVDKLEQAQQEPVEFCFSVPPRHFKSFTIFHAIAWWLKQDPTQSIAYITYAKEVATEQAEKAKRVVQHAGIPLGGKQRQDHWETVYGGSVTAQGVRGQITGKGFNKIIVDDPHASRDEAESGVIRRRVVEGIRGDIYSRQMPGGTSLFVVHTRWHEADAIGELSRSGWEYVNLPAIDDRGNPLCPDHWPLDKLEQIRRNTGDYEWASLYMGQPRPRGQELFGAPVTCDWADLPAHGRDAIGVDLAYTAKTHADYSVSLVLRRSRTPSGDKTFVMDVQREQCSAPDFAQRLQRHSIQHPGSPMWWYCAGTEKGAADFVVQRGIPLSAKPATTDKMQRALPVSAAWNAGDIVVPRNAPWAEALIREVTSFTGLNDPHDDIVDALAAGYDALEQGTYESTPVQSWGRRTSKQAHRSF